MEKLKSYIFKDSHNPVSNFAFAAINRKIERMSKLIYFSMLKINAPGIMLPSFFISMINYYVLDLGDKSFSLLCPVMYVMKKKIITLSHLI